VSEGLEQTWVMPTQAPTAYQYNYDLQNFEHEMSEMNKPREFGFNST